MISLSSSIFFHSFYFQSFIPFFFLFFTHLFAFIFLISHSLCRINN
eukprot:UN10768